MVVIRVHEYDDGNDIELVEPETIARSDGSEVQVLYDDAQYWKRPIPTDEPWGEWTAIDDDNDPDLADFKEKQED